MGAFARVAGRRLARALATLLALAVAAWLCLEAAPGDPAEAAARAGGLLPGEGGRPVPPDVRARIVDGVARHNGLRRSAPARLASWIGHAARGDFGRSWRTGVPVARELRRALPATLILLLAGLLTAYLVGLAGALAAASSPGGARDRAVSLAAAIAVAVPPAWGAVLALRAFASGKPFTWFPPSGGWLLPIASVSYVAVAAVARFGRAGLVGACAEPFAVAARARGASSARVLGVHALGVARAPLAALLPVLVPSLLGAAVIVERVFDVHGLGALLLDAARAGDAPVILGVTLVAGALVALSSLVADLLMTAADPRLRVDR